MKVKTLIKKLQRLDPDSDIYTRPRLFGIFPPKFGVMKMIYRRLPKGKKGWETEDVFHSRKGQYKASFIKSKLITYIG